MLVLRDFQEAAKSAVYLHLRTRDDNPLVVVPTGGGKTPIMALICKDAVTIWDGRVLVLAHVKELLEQTAEKLRAVCPEVRFGVYSAGLKRRETKQQVIVAGIQSVFRRACELDAFDLIIVDEAHTIPPEGDGMYQQFLADAKTVNPHLRIIGFTATPFRLKDGPICTPDHFLNHICYEVGVRELIRDGYLCPLVTKAGIQKADTSGLHVRAGEFVSGELETLMDQDDLVEAACREIVQYTADRKSVLIFTSGVAHAHHVARELQDRHGAECRVVYGNMPIPERDHLLDRFRRQDLKYLANMNVLTTGFDAPGVDCVVLLRPTMSAGLYYQMVGRRFRLHPEKKNCLVLDFGGNVLRHGPVDEIRVATQDFDLEGEAPAKECPKCHALIAAGYSICPDCGFRFPLRTSKGHTARASDAEVLSRKVVDTEYEVRDVAYAVHHKRDAPEEAPRTMRVGYRLGLDHWQSEFICFEHTGYARRKAVAWWERRSPDPVPDTAEQAVELAEAGALCQTQKITVRSVAGEKFDRIIGYVLGPVPEPVTAGEEEEVPF